MQTLLILLLSLFWLGCAGPSATSTATDMITVEGSITVRGNVPFTGFFLETDQHNLYVLVISEEEQQTLQETMPGRFRITGKVYADDWHGRRLAHLRPTSIERL